MTVRLTLAALTVAGSLFFTACSGPALDNIQPAFFDSPYFPASKDGKWGFVDADQQVKINFEYDSVYQMQNGVALVGKGNKYGYIDSTGKIIIPLEYDLAAGYHDSLAWVKKDGKFGVVNLTTRQLVVPLAYDKVGTFDISDYAEIWMGAKVGLINRKGQVVLQPDTGAVERVGGGWYTVREKQGWRLMNELDKSKGNGVWYEAVSYRNRENGYIPVKKNGLWGFVNEQQQLVIPCQFEKHSYFQEGFCAVWKNDKVGFINAKGQLTVPCMYDNAWEFNDGYATVGIGKENGLIDTLNNAVIPVTYPNVSRTYPGKRYIATEVDKNDIDNFNNIIYYRGKKELELRRRIFVLDDSDGNIYYIIQIGKLFGIVDTTGKLVVPATWQVIHKKQNGFVYYSRSSEGNYVRVTDGGGTGVLNIKTGEVVVKPSYRNLEASGIPGVYIATVSSGMQLVKVNDFAPPAHK